MEENSKDFRDRYISSSDNLGVYKGKGRGRRKAKQVATCTRNTNTCKSGRQVSGHVDMWQEGSVLMYLQLNTWMLCRKPSGIWSLHM